MLLSIHPKNIERHVEDAASLGESLQTCASVSCRTTFNRSNRSLVRLGGGGRTTTSNHPSSFPHSATGSRRQTLIRLPASRQ